MGSILTLAAQYPKVGLRPETTSFRKGGNHTFAAPHKIRQEGQEACIRTAEVMALILSDAPLTLNQEVRPIFANLIAVQRSHRAYEIN